MSFAFRAFPKIGAATGAVAAGEWVATEKIHGAQLVVAADATTVRVGKRKAWLQPHEAFFGWQLLRPLLEQGARSIYQGLGAFGVVWIYGELYGGYYPHPAVSGLAALTPVQTGIWYSPNLNFAVFDVLHDDGTVAEFVSHDELNSLLTASGMSAVPLLSRGGRAELECLTLRYPSGVPAMLGLPRLDDNWAEGYVLKPARRSAAEARPIIKYKIPEFDEKRFDESRPFDATVHLSLDELSALADALVNPARIASARSKVGVELEAVVDEAVLDALVDLHELFPQRMAALDSDEEAGLTERLTSRARVQAERSPSGFGGSR